MQQGQFVISLDFELLWGVRDKKTIEGYGANIRGVRQVIPALLQLFEKYGVHATFATVGFLFARNKEELMTHVPAILPNYAHQKYSPYKNHYLDSIGPSEKEDIYHYAGSLIRAIQQCPGQEIASHTFSHYYCLEQASLASFEADMTAAKKIAATYGVDLKSIVFPRNQYSQDHIDICKKLGFTAYRGNESSALYNPRRNEEQSRKIRAVRLADSYVNLTGHHTSTLERMEGIINIPSSRFLRPYSKRLAPLDPLRLKRIKSSLSYAARNGACYHLWWHPHNFGVNLPQNLAFLEEILKHYQMLHVKLGMKSRTMKEISEEILIANAV